MTEARAKNLRSADETIRLPGIVEEVVELGDITVGRVVQAPGWRWSTHIKPVVGGDWCEARHVGVVIEGRLGAVFRDGTTIEMGPDDVYDLPPGHDGYTIGDEPAVLIEWAGLRTFAREHATFQGRSLLTLLFTDVVDSTATALHLGDTAWRETMSLHYQAMRATLERYRGREIDTTGDGLLATFDGPAAALRCAASMLAKATGVGLQLRAGVHVGEVEVIGPRVRGLAVHEGARIMAQANPGEILVSDITRALASTAGLSFQDRGTHELKGLTGTWHLYAYSGESAAVTARDP